MDSNPARMSLLALALFLCSCGDAPSLIPPSRLDIPDSVVVASMGILEGEDDSQVISLAREAALSETGRYLAVGDRDEPLIHLLDLSTGKSWAFGRRGEGPGEFRDAQSIEFVGDSVVLVLSWGRIEEFKVSGEPIRNRQIRELGIRAVAFTRACGGVEFYYGSPIEVTRSASDPIVHEAVGTGPILLPRLNVPGRASLGFGGLYGFAGNAEGLSVWYRRSGIEVGYWIPCQGDPVIIHQRGTEMDVRQALQVAGHKAETLILPDTLFQGLVIQDRAVAHALLWKDGETEVTSINVIEGERCRVLELFGSWLLADLRFNKAVLVTRVPFPMVKVVDWGWVTDNLTATSCS